MNIKSLNLFQNIYRNKTVLITGHTGFKGSWLTLWLNKMGANVIGYSLKPPTQPNHIELLKLDIISITGDIRNEKKLHKVFKIHNPDIVFHLAAQPLVRASYDNPIETYDTNVMGTLKVFETSRKYKVKAIVNITSDKVYYNKEWLWGYRENDRLGGYDPYSSSKACSELLTSSYRNSFLNLSDYKKTHHTLIASCRSGNVIGGGDWAKDRLFTDIITAAAKKEKISIRSPYATRPWQHVLEALSGYLLIGQQLLEENTQSSDAWNFGSPDKNNQTVQTVLEDTKKLWNDIEYKIETNNKNPHEAQLLKLDSSKAKEELQWENTWSYKKALKKAILWYKDYYKKGAINSDADLVCYIKNATKKGLTWTKN